LVREVLRTWQDLTRVFGDQLFERLPDRSDLWEVAAPWVEDFPKASDAFESYLREVAGTKVGWNTLEAMARLLPRTDELRETCLADMEGATLQHPTDLNAFHLLGVHFGGDAVLLERLRGIRQVQVLPQGQRVGPEFYWKVFLALCYGWPTASEIQEWLHRPRQDWDRMPWYAAFHLDRIGGQPQHFMDDLIAFLQSCAEDSSVVDEELTDAIAMWAAHDANAELLKSLLSSEYSSDVATAAGFLSRAGKMNSHLAEQLAELFETELASTTRPPRTGLDLSRGQLRPVVEVIFEALDRSSS